MNKLLIIINFCILFPLSGFSQFSVDVGKDTTYCYSICSDKKLYLVKDVKIKNGMEPYTFAWECTVPVTSRLTFTASDFLNDTTQTVPYFVDHHLDQKWVKYILHVTDKNGDRAKDSLRVRFSSFGYSIDYQVIELAQGDSFLIGAKGVTGGISPLKFLQWTPTNGLSNTTDASSWCKPVSSTDYFSVFIDSAGCSSCPQLNYEVHVLSTGNSENKLQSNCTPFQLKSRIHFCNPEKKKAIITIYSMNGEKLSNSSTYKDFFEIDHLLNSKGIYIVDVLINKRRYALKYLKN